MKLRPAANVRGFTLIELLCVICIIAILAGIIAPVTQNIINRAYDTKCANNLRQIGAGANAAANDNNNTYPIVEIDGNGTPVANTLDVPAQTLDIALAPYGVTAQILQCPMDLHGPNYYAQMNPHSSYMWSPYSEETNSVAPTVYRRRSQSTVSPSRLQLASDWSPVHEIVDGAYSSGKMVYSLYGDGHVKTTRRNIIKH